MVNLAYLGVWFYMLNKKDPKTGVFFWSFFTGISLVTLDNIPLLKNTLYSPVYTLCYFLPIVQLTLH